MPLHNSWLTGDDFTQLRKKMNNSGDGKSKGLEREGSADFMIQEADKTRVVRLQRSVRAARLLDLASRACF